MRLEEGKGYDREEKVKGINYSKTDKDIGVVGDAKLQKVPPRNDHIEPENEEVDTSCGIWRLRTNVLGGCFSNLYVFALLVGVSGLFTTMVDRIVPVQLKSLEKQFNIDNAKAGLLTSSSKFGLMSTILIAGHFTKTYQVAFIIVLVIQVLKGVTDTFHSFFLPTVYMDDNVIEKSKMSIYMGIRQLFTNLAQPIGTEINGVLTEIPVDLTGNTFKLVTDTVNVTHISVLRNRSILFYLISGMSFVYGVKMGCEQRRSKVFRRP
ncbi:hypothetical protein Btru_012015 [Bulinus truncatus]|nr:hypothetical protein Btru_012015 [Bulinus truncatus]